MVSFPKTAENLFALHKNAILEDLRGGIPRIGLKINTTTYRNREGKIYLTVWFAFERMPHNWSIVVKDFVRHIVAKHGFNLCYMTSGGSSKYDGDATFRIGLGVE